MHTVHAHFIVFAYNLISQHFEYPFTTRKWKRALLGQGRNKGENITLPSKHSTFALGVMGGVETWTKISKTQ